MLQLFSTCQVSLIHQLFVALPTYTETSKAAFQSAHASRATTVNRGIFRNVPVWSAAASSDSTRTLITNQIPECTFECIHLSILEIFDDLNDRTYAIQFLQHDDNKFSVLNYQNQKYKESLQQNLMRKIIATCSTLLSASLLHCQIQLASATQFALLKFQAYLSNVPNTEGDVFLPSVPIKPFHLLLIQILN